MLTERTAIAVVEKHLLSLDSIPVKIRSNSDVLSSDFESLEAAILHLIELYKNQKSVPKILALAFVDISVCFENRFRTQAEQQRFEDYGHRLSELANRLFDDESCSDQASE